MREEATQTAAGKALRKQIPRTSYGEWAPQPGRPDPIAVLEESNVGRLPNLVPVRHARLKRSAFTFFRGFPSMTAYDLGTGRPTTGIIVQSCGDCHLENFGIYATPERNVIFDINDFDETTPAPWEWDVERLTSSIEVAGIVNGFSQKQRFKAVLGAVSAYRKTMLESARKTRLQCWYTRIDASDFLRVVGSAELHRAVLPSTAPDDSHELIAEQYTEGIGLGAKIVDKPPKLFHPPPDGEVIVDAREVFERYKRSLRDDLQVLFGAYELTDLAIKVVGIGSVGTRCAVALLKASADDALILQIKEARPSVLAPYAGSSEYKNNGQRVVAGQLLMQSASDVLLGWSDSDDGHQFYIRQLSDMKWSADVSIMSASELQSYAALCGQVLAVAHARSGNAELIAGYLGSSSTFDAAIAEFAETYAQQVLEDYEIFMHALETGRLSAE
jgi:uncharacterized protein (DUF2252 family)